MTPFFFARILFAVIVLSGIFFVVAAHAAHTNISTVPDEHWAWNESIGWIDFHNVNVESKRLTGYAETSNFGEISLSCETPPGGGASICGQSDYKVVNDGSGVLSGWAWNEVVGWISFCGGQSTSECPGSVIYGVTLSTGATGSDFQGWAWNDMVGWISFNCIGHGCSVGYKVRTSWFPQAAAGTLDSSVFDTQSVAGAQPNSLIWKGDRPVGTDVFFQVAVSNCPNGATNPLSCTTGSWNFIGPSGTSGDHYIPTQRPDGSFTVKLKENILANYRYLRYRVFLQSNTIQSISPRVDDIIINWSP